MTQVLGLLISLAAAIGVLYVLRRPRWAVLLVIIMFPLEQLIQSYVPLFNTHRSLFNVLIGFLARFAVASRMFQREQVTSGVWNPVTVFSLAIVFLCGVGLLWSPSRDTAAGMVQSALPYVVLMFILTPLLLDDLDDFRRLAWGVMIFGTTIAILIIANPRSSFYGGRLTLDLGSYTGADGGRANPLALANMGGVMALIAVLIRVERPTPLLMLLRLGAIAFGLGLAITSGSRGQVLAAGVAGVLFYPMARRVANPRQFFLTAGGLAFLGGLLFLVFRLFVGHENRERWDVTKMVGDSAERFNMAADLTLEWLSTPTSWIQGLGTNAFTTLTPYGDTPYVHNVLVEAFAELGLLGGTALCIVMYFTTRYGYRLWKRYQYDPVQRSLAAILLAIALYNLLIMLKQGSLAGQPYALMWWVVLSRIAAHEERLAEAEIESSDDEDDAWSGSEPDSDDGDEWFDHAAAVDGYESWEEYDDRAVAR